MTKGNISHKQYSLIALQNICLNSEEDTRAVLECDELLQSVVKWSSDRMADISSEAWHVVLFSLHKMPNSSQKLGECVAEPLVE